MTTTEKAASLDGCAIGVAVGRVTVVDVVVGRLNPLIARGLTSVLAEDRHLRVAATDVDYPALVRVLARLVPGVAILARPPDRSQLARLRLIDSRVALLVMVYEPKPSYVSLLRSVNATCIPYSAEPRALLDAIHIAVHERDQMRGRQEPAARYPEPRTSLTPRETQVLDGLIAGSSYRKIGDTLDIGIETVRTHAASIRRKLAVATNADLVYLKSASAHETPPVDCDRTS